MSTKGDDHALALAARDGDKVSFAALFERHRPMLTALCRRALGESSLVEDAVQEAALRALLGIGQLRRPEQFGPWLGGIGLNVCRLWIRQRSRDAWSWEALVGGRAFEERPNAREDPADQAEEAEVVARVRRAVDGLPPGQRAAVVLFYLAGLTVAETAAQLGIAPGAVKTRLHKARGGLKPGLEDLWEESMRKKTARQPVEVRVVDVQRVRVGEGDRQRVLSHVVLREAAGARTLRIWMGENEATAIALRLESVEFSRPGPYHLMDSLLRSVGGEVREAVIERLADDVYYSTILVEGPGGSGKVDARPSDAINLALIAAVPIRVAEEVFRAAGVQGESTSRDVVERGPEIAARVVEGWKAEMPSHLGTYQSTAEDLTHQETGSPDASEPTRRGAVGGASDPMSA